MKNYIVFDIETTGLPVEKNGTLDFAKVGVTEIGAVECNSDHKRVGGFSALLRQPVGYEISPEAQEVSGISHELLLCEGLPPLEALGEFQNFISYGADWLVGHNIINFDIPAIRAFSAHLACPINFGNLIFIDTKLAWKAWCLGMKRGKFEDLLHFYGRVQAERYHVKTSLIHVLNTMCGRTVKQGHRAEGDACLTSLVFGKLYSRGIIEAVLGDI